MQCDAMKTSMQHWVIYIEPELLGLFSAILLALLPPAEQVTGR